MKEQQKILKYINDNHKLRDKIEDNEYQIEIFSRSFLKQLMKIVNWEILVEAYSSDYYHSPDSFFNRCRVEYYDDEILFVKDYSNGESYTVLELDLNTPIEKQDSCDIQSK